MLAYHLFSGYTNGWICCINLLLVSGSLYAYLTECILFWIFLWLFCGFETLYLNGIPIRWKWQISVLATAFKFLCPRDILAANIMFNQNSIVLVQSIVLCDHVCDHFITGNIACCEVLILISLKSTGTTFRDRFKEDVCMHKWREKRYNK